MVRVHVDLTGPPTAEMLATGQAQRDARKALTAAKNAARQKSKKRCRSGGGDGIQLVGQLSAEDAVDKRRRLAEDAGAVVELLE